MPIQPIPPAIHDEVLVVDELPAIRHQWGALARFYETFRALYGGRPMPDMDMDIVELERRDEACMTSLVPPRPTRLLNAEEELAAREAQLRAALDRLLFQTRPEPSPIAPPPTIDGNRWRRLDPWQDASSHGTEPPLSASPTNAPSAGATNMTVTINLIQRMAAFPCPDLVPITDVIRKDPATLAIYEGHNERTTARWKSRRKERVHAVVAHNINTGNMPYSHHGELYQHYSRSSALENRRGRAAAGRLKAMCLAMAKKDLIAALTLMRDEHPEGSCMAPDFDLFNTFVPSPVRDALAAYRSKIYNGEWKEFRRHLGYAGVETFFHVLHVSTEDPTMLAYARNIDALLAGRFTKIKPGRYLSRFYSSRLDESQIKHMVEQFNIEAKKDEACNQIKWIENTDPDGWEWVYEHGHGFSSCMVYDHPHERHLAEELHGLNHPVRAYAYAGNGLRLAYLGDGVRVFARAIVNEARKGFVRNYGDSRLKLLLINEGYREDSCCTEDVRIHARVINDDMLILPYLDGSPDGVEWDGESSYMVIGGDDYSSCATGYATIDTPRVAVCEDCDDDIYDEDEVNHVGVYEDRCVCDSCSRNYTWANTWSPYHRRQMAYIHDDDVVTCESDGESYDVNTLDRYDIHVCEHSENYYHIDDLVGTSRGLIADAYAVELDREDPDGNTYAHPADTVEVVHEGELITIHEDSEDEYPEDEEVADEKAVLLPVQIAAAYNLVHGGTHEYHPHHFDKEQEHDQATLARTAAAAAAVAPAYDERFCLAA